VVLNQKAERTVMQTVFKQKMKHRVCDSENYKLILPSSENM